MQKNSAPPGRLAVSELDDHLGFWLRYVSNHVSAQFAGMVQANGVTVSEWVALRQLYRSGQAAPTELMTALGMTKGAVSKIVTRLEKKGLLSRTAQGLDRRAQQLALTPAGQELVPLLASLADKNDEIFFAHLSAQQRSELMAMMQQIVRLHQMQELPAS